MVAFGASGGLAMLGVIRENLGGRVSSAPAAVVRGEHGVDLFAKGMDNAIWHKWWDGRNWSDWESLHGVHLILLLVYPLWSANRLDVFATDANRAVWHKWWDGNAWSDWENLGGTVSSAPAAVYSE